jgi:hypothetical protein
MTSAIAGHYRSETLDHSMAAKTIVAVANPSAPGQTQTGPAMKDNL